MATLQELTNQFNELAPIANKLGGEFPENIKKFKIKTVEAEAKVKELQDFIEANKEESNKMAKKDKKSTTTEQTLKVSYGHWTVLQMFKKDEMKVEKLQEAYVKATEKERGLALILSQMVKKGFVEQYEEEGVKIAELTKEGKLAKETAEPEKPAEKAKAKVKPPFQAVYSEEEINSAKKKKAKKMQAANEAAFAEYEEKYKDFKPPRASNNYDGKIEIGPNQEELPAKASMTAKSKAAARDYFEANVTKGIRMKKLEYVAALEAHGLTKTTAIAIWKECTAEGCNEERLAIANSRGAGAILPELETKKKGKDKVKKDKKKDKKQEEVKTDKKKKDKSEKPEKTEKKKDKKKK